MRIVIILLLSSGLLFSQTTGNKSSKLIHKSGSESELTGSYTEKAELIGSFTNSDQDPLNFMGFGGNVSNVFPDRVRSFTTVTEEADPNKGKIWSIIGIENADPSMPDKIEIYYSDDNGASWTGFGSGILGNDHVLFPGQLDAEIVSNPNDPNSHKFLFIAFTYATGSYVSGAKRTGLFVLDITVSAGGLWQVNIPGGADNQYYDLRITSDNEKYPVIPYIYMVCTVDSTLQNGDIITMQRIARIEEPYNYISNPQIIYRSASLEQSVTVSGSLTTKASSDIVFLPVTSDKLYYSLSHPNSDGIWINNTSISGDNTSEQTYHIDVNIPITDHKMSGSFTDSRAQIMLVAERNVSGNNDDLVSYKLDMRNGASSQFSVISVGTGSGVPRHPQIISPRLMIDDYKVSFSMNIASNPDRADSILFVESDKVPGNSWGTITRVSLKTGSINWRSKYSAVGIKLDGVDNTLVFWGHESGDFGFIGNELWCTFISGIPTDVETEGVTPLDFALSQNYPNPFNPSTTIKYAIPEASFVQLKVYDILGKEVVTLVNGQKAGGNHSVKFDATDLTSGIYFYIITSGNFTATKKLILLK